MTFEIGEIVIYLDAEGYFPSLNGKECIIQGFDNHLGLKYLIV